MAEHDTAFKGGFFKEHGRYGKQHVKPAAGLIDSLADEIGGEVFFEEIAVFKGIMELSKRHGAAVIPTVYDFRNATHNATAFAREGHLIDIRAVKFDVFVAARKLMKFFSASDDVFFSAFFTDPYGKRCSPVSFSRNAPVDEVFEEISHSSFPDGLGHPVDGIV